jgi:hypothetical protein
MKNLLLEKVEYKVERTYFGSWRTYVYETGARFAEFKTHDGILGLPFIHYTAGICPETGKRLVARGIIAVGRKAVGALALGQAAFGIAAVGQLAVATVFGLGQVATGYVAIGQFAFGYYTLAQFGFGEHVWSTRGADPVAVDFFKNLLCKAKSFLGG